jgi:hypothetical protein
MPIRLRPLAVAAASVVAAACLDSAENIVGIFVPGAPARVIQETVAAAGGQITRTTVTVDSATATYEVVICQGGVTGPCSEMQRRSGDVPGAMLTELFEAAQTREFKRLKEEYRLNTEYTPPDGSWTLLSVTVGERERSIEWQEGADLPDVLERFLCRLDTIQGSLALCG